MTLFKAQKNFITKGGGLMRKQFTTEQSAMSVWKEKGVCKMCCWGFKPWRQRRKPQSPLTTD